MISELSRRNDGALPSPGAPKGPKCENYLRYFREDRKRIEKSRTPNRTPSSRSALGPERRRLIRENYTRGGHFGGRHPRARPCFFVQSAFAPRPECRTLLNPARPHGHYASLSLSLSSSLMGLPGRQGKSALCSFCLIIPSHTRWFTTRSPLFRLYSRSLGFRPSHKGSRERE